MRAFAARHLMVISMLTLIVGCATIDKYFGNGDGKVDLSAIDIGIEFRNPDTGEVYSVVSRDGQVDVVLTLEDSNGVKYVAKEGFGSFEVVSPSGVALQIGLPTQEGD